MFTRKKPFIRIGKFERRGDEVLWLILFLVFWFLFDFTWQGAIWSFLLSIFIGNLILVAIGYVKDDPYH